MTVIFVLSPSGMATGRRAASALGAALHARHPGGDLTVAAAGEHLRRLFAEGMPIVFVGATGALVRILAPVLADKLAEPPVLVVAEDGSAVIPILGGHRGGNDLARRLGAALGVAPAVTTASDLAFGVALDRPPPGYALADPGQVKPFVAALLAGAGVRLEGRAPWLADAALPWSDSGPLRIHVDHRAGGDSGVPDPGRLDYRPAVLAVGVGCERGVEPAELLSLVRETLAEARLAPASVAAIVSLDLKRDEPAVHAVAASLNRPARFFDAEHLERETPRLANPSPVVHRAVGCHGVAEAAALAAAGPDGVLIVPKRRSRRATCAIGLAPGVIEAGAIGRPRGRLAVVGIGPGGAGWRTGEAERALAGAEDLVGYRGYLDLLEPAAVAADARRHPFPLGAEQARVAHALDLAAAGRSVALVCSGDPGIYAMASLVMEMLDRDGNDGWRKAEICVLPGISAMQACAARVGAPLGHDFCAISLSDLLTPWETIRRRIAAAAAGDFVIAFYNPVSARRDWQLAAARDLLLRHRAPETPVAIGRALGRPGEAVEVTSLGALDAVRLDMLSIVLVGASQTRRLGGRIYTPRGYAAAGADRGAGA